VSDQVCTAGPTQRRTSRTVRPIGADPDRDQASPATVHALNLMSLSITGTDWTRTSRLGTVSVRISRAANISSGGCAQAHERP
jgi:hypothetical protein